MTLIGNTQNQCSVELSLLSLKGRDVLEMCNKGNDWEGEIKTVLF